MSEIVLLDLSSVAHPIYSERFLARFVSRIAIVESGCWLWTGGKDRKGYGSIGYNRKKLKAHRISWELRHGSIPPGMLVCHKCDTPACQNPSHLFLGTPADNSADMVTKGRASHAPRAIGTKNGSAKINPSAVRTVRRLIESGTSQKMTAALVGISASQVGNIAHGRHWSHVQ